jgi:glycosyltransferase involved in cell wall biosynthesis
MNILQIVSSSRISGAEKHVVVLSDRLRRRGHEVLAVCPRGDWLPGQLAGAAVPTWELKFRGPHAIRCLTDVLRYVRHNRVDIIHAHLTKATYIGYVVGRLTGLPLISSLHTRTTDLVYRRLMPAPKNRIITVSNFLRDMLIAQGIPAWMLTTIYNGTEFFEAGESSDELLPGAIAGEAAPEPLPLRAELSLPKDAELIGLFGHVDEQKGHPLLVQAARAIVRQRPRAYFVFVGKTDARMQRMLWEMASADGVADRLRYMGVRNDIPRLMDEMDVVTVPSQIESFGMVIIEAMARSKPVVAARVGGIPELITDGETGLLVDRNPAELADAIVGLLHNPGKRDSIGRQGCRHARTHFSAETMVDNIEALYGSLVNGDGHRAR